MTAIVHGHVCPTHGFYLPEGVRFTGLNTDRHVVYLYRLKPGHVRRTKVRIGEVRKSRRPGYRGERCWRAFPERGGEFPELFENHKLALEYLVKCWDAGPLVVEPTAPRPARKWKPPPMTAPAAPGPWVKFFGEDPFNG